MPKTKLGMYKITLAPSTWYQVLGTKDLVRSTWCQVLVPDILYQVPDSKYLVASNWYQVLGTKYLASVQMHLVPST